MSGMTRVDRRFARHLTLALLLKALLLGALWWVFVRPIHIPVSADRVFEHFATTPTTQGEPR